MSLSPRVYNFRRFSSSRAQIEARINSEKLDAVIRRPNLFTTATTSEFPLTFCNSPKIGRYSVLSMSHLKEGNGIDMNGVGMDCEFYYQVVYNEEKGHCYNENAYFFHQKWNGLIGFHKKLLELPMNRTKRKMYDRYLDRLQTFDPKNVCVFFIFCLLGLDRSFLIFMFKIGCAYGCSCKN